VFTFVYAIQGYYTCLLTVEYYDFDFLLAV
jgi:hypothetical protein